MFNIAFCFIIKVSSNSKIFLNFLKCFLFFAEFCLRVWNDFRVLCSSAGQATAWPGGAALCRNNQAAVVSIRVSRRQQVCWPNYLNLCWLFTIKDRCKEVCFLQTQSQDLPRLFLTDSWDLRGLHDTPDSLLVSMSQLKRLFKGLRQGSCWEEWKRTILVHANQYL